MRCVEHDVGIAMHPTSIARHVCCRYFRQDKDFLEDNGLQLDGVPVTGLRSHGRPDAGTCVGVETAAAATGASLLAAARRAPRAMAQSGDAAGVLPANDENAAE